MKISLMEKKDVSQVARLEHDNFSMPWKEKDFYEVLENPDACYVVAKSQEDVVGVCGFLSGFGEAELFNVSVDRKRRNRGIASEMLQKLVEEGKKREIHAFTLEVRKSNLAAIHLYGKLGFVQEGVRPGFYENPKEDAVIMWKRES